MNKYKKYLTPDHAEMVGDLTRIKLSGPGGGEGSLDQWILSVFHRAETVFGMDLLQSPTVRDAWILFDSLKLIERVS